MKYFKYIILVANYQQKEPTNIFNLQKMDETQSPITYLNI